MLIMLLASALAAEPCEPMTPYSASLELDAWGATVELAQGVIQRFEAEPMCLDTFAPSALRGLYQKAAYLAILSENESLARTWLRRAATADISAPPLVVDGDTSGILDLWESIATRVTQGKKGTVKPKSMVWLDGHALSRQTPYQVPIGPHILQYATPHGMVTERLQVNTGDMLRPGRTNWQLPTTIGGGVLIAGGVGTLLGSRVLAALRYTEDDPAFGTTSDILVATGATLAAAGFSAVATAALFKPLNKRKPAARKKW